jgi:hypothetical protein
MPYRSTSHPRIGVAIAAASAEQANALDSSPRDQPNSAVNARRKLPNVKTMIDDAPANRQNHEAMTDAHPDRFIFHSPSVSISSSAGVRLPT